MTLKVTLFLIAAVGFAGCSTPKTTYHTAYKLTACEAPISRDKVTDALLKRGYQKSSETKGPYDVFHRPEITKKRTGAADPYEDKAGDIGVAVCSGGSESYILSEEIRGCEGKKECTVENQKELKTIAQEWGCQIDERSGRSKSWNLEDRQDWTRESCSFIATNLQF